MSKKELNYITLFSGAGVGCYGFKIENFNCIATNEIIEKRLRVQKFNKVCKKDTAYILGDIQNNEIKEMIFREIEKNKQENKNLDIDVIIATPPCQGMSVVNLKKKNEKRRNSLVVQSIELINKIRPKFFIFENVRSFSSTICTDLDGKDKKIKDAIVHNLGGFYNVLFRVINLKDYGSNSSRTRTIVIGSRKDLYNITPYSVFPNPVKEKTLRQVIGNFPKLENFGEIDKNDILHSFRPYPMYMIDWIKDLEEGQSAFENMSIDKRPYKELNGERISNKNKSGDKYKRCYWDKAGPCIHTRNDQLASQSTIHPRDNRVFSIRELMRMMTIPDSFKWVEQSLDELNNLDINEKRRFLEKEEMNIRQSIGEAVPTEIFRQIATKISGLLLKERLNNKSIKALIKIKKLNNINNLLKFIKRKENNYSLPELFKIIESANAEKLKNAAFYTRQDICFSIVKELPESTNYKELNIIEPSVGAGNFLPLLFEKYREAKQVNLDIVDINNNSLNIIKTIIKRFGKPKNFYIRYLNQDFLLNKFNKKYDIVIGNPPFGKITNDPGLLFKYKNGKYNKKTNNIFSYFIEEAVKIGNMVAFLSPKSLLSAPEFNDTRKFLSNCTFKSIIDYGERAFSDVKIETISFVIDTTKKPNNSTMVKVESYITNNVNFLKQEYIFPEDYPIWLIYRDKLFDGLAKKLEFNIFEIFRDRKITKNYIRNQGKIRLLKSRNIGDNKIINIRNYDCFVDNIDDIPVFKFLNKKNCVLVPNLTYNPRATFLPKDAVADGSVAILTPHKNIKITKSDLEYYSSGDFKRFYMITKNLGSRSLNVDKNSVYFFGKIKK